MAEPARDSLADLYAPAKVRVLDGVKARPRDEEFGWLREHAHEYAGQWIALDGNRLLAAAPRLKDLRGRLTPVDIERNPLFHRVVLD